MILEIVRRQAVSWLDLDSSRKILLSVGKDNVIKLWNIKEILEVRIFSSLSLFLNFVYVVFFVVCFCMCLLPRILSLSLSTCSTLFYLIFSSLPTIICVYTNLEFMNFLPDFFTIVDYKLGY